MSGTLRVVMTLAIRSASLLSSALLVFAIATKLSAVDQGVYYLLQGLIALTFFFDLGIGFVLANMVGKAQALRDRSEDQRDLEKAKVAQFGLRWSLSAALCFVLVVSFVGLGQVAEVADGPANWTMWALLLCGSAINLALGTVLSLYEGLGFTSQISVIRFAQAFLNALLFLLVVSFTRSPFSIGIATLLSVVIAASLFALKFGKDWLAMLRRPLQAPLNWHKTILPFQWRIAISWLTGYFMFQAPILVVAAWGDLVDAGQFGLTMQIFLAIISVAQVYLTFCVPHWAAIMVSSDGKGAYLEYGKSVAITLMINLAAGMAVLASTRLSMLADFSDRLLDAGELRKLLLGTCGFQMFMCGNFYFRAQIREALWPVSILGACIMIAGGFYFRDSVGSTVMVDLYLLTGITLALLSFALVSLDYLFRKRRMARDSGSFVR